jgi:hypothetical protein
MPYTVSAICVSQRRVETRSKSSSAVVLAMKWEKEGCVNVTVANDSGQSFDVKTAQQRLSQGLHL